MYRSLSFLGLGLISTLCFAKPCQFHRSCLELNNNTSQFVRIKCNGLDEVASAANSRGSTQLDLGWGDGMGAPDPRQINCTISQGGVNNDFSFYNPYWGAIIDFELISEKGLEVVVNDGWSAKKKYYTFNW